MVSHCEICGGICQVADVAPLRCPELKWLWEQIGRVADRRGDQELISGTVKIIAPESPEERAAAVGLTGSRILAPGQSRTVDLAQLTQKLRVRGEALTPGTVAAHVLGRRLAVRAAADKLLRERTQQLKAAFLEASAPVLLDSSTPDQTWDALRRTGWVARLAGLTDAQRLLQSAVAVLGELPAEGEVMDRRFLASAVTANPHALDYGLPLTALVIALLTASGRVEAGMTPRDIWAAVGVRSDDVVGGLISIGIFPARWSVPGGVPVTISPRALRTCDWPEPESSDQWVFVTENPSVISAAAESPNISGIRLLCTNGTPSGVEIGAVARLAQRGWRIAVRADFDAAGLAHMHALTQGIPGAVPWRMGVRDYLQSLTSRMEDRVALTAQFDVSWDDHLARVMKEHNAAAYEESLLGLLLEDLRVGHPPERADDSSAV